MVKVEIRQINSSVMRAPVAPPKEPATIPGQRPAPDLTPPIISPFTAPGEQPLVDVPQFPTQAPPQDPNREGCILESMRLVQTSMTRIGIPDKKPERREVPFAPPVPFMPDHAPGVSPPATPQPVRTPQPVPATK